MDLVRFNEIINCTNSLKKEDVSELKELVEKFPYFQTAHVLYLKALHSFDPEAYAIHLDNASMIIPDRNRFVDWIEITPEITELLGNDQKIVESGNKTEKNQIEAEDKEVWSAGDENDEKETAQEDQPASFPVEEPGSADISSKGTRKKTPGELIRESIANKLSDQIISANQKNKLEKLIEPNVEAVFNQAGKKEENDETRDEFELIEDKQSHEHNEDKENDEKKIKLPGGEYFQAIDLLQLDDGKPIDSPDETNNEFKLIDQFLEKSASKEKVVPEENNIPDHDLSEQSTHENEHIMTETLAEIYVRQGMKENKKALIDKAIHVYQKLSLKFPEKNSYFASKIDELKNYKFDNH